MDRVMQFRLRLYGLALVVLLLMNGVAVSAQVEIDGINYNLSAETLTAVVTSKPTSTGYGSRYSGSIVIPETVTYEGVNYTVTSIGPMAFNYSSITSIAIPKTVTSCGGFGGCSYLTSIVVAPENMYLDSRNNCNAIIKTATNTLIAGCCKTRIPNTVTHIGGGAFFACYSLSSITIPSSVKGIGSLAFAECYDLKDVFMVEETPSEINVSGDAFYNCHALTTINVPAGSATFYNETPWNDYKIVEYYEVDGVYFNLNEDKNTAQITSNPSFYFGKVVLPKTIMLDGKTYSVTAIGSSAFSNCSDLTSVVIPSTITNISYSAFRYSENLDSIIVPNSVVEIGIFAFYGCLGLKSITIGNSVANIGHNAFSKCTQLANIHMKGNNPPSVYANVGTFTDCHNLSTIYVPYGLTSAYNSKPWNNYSIREETYVDIMDNGVLTYVQAGNIDKDRIYYVRDFTHTRWQSLYVPFDIPYGNISDDFAVAALNDVHQFDDDNDGVFDRTELEILHLKAGDIIQHNTPYAICAKEVGEHTITVEGAVLYAAEENELDCSSTQYRYVFCGTYSGVGGVDMLHGGYYAFSGGSLCKAVSESVALGGLRWYVRVEDRSTGLPSSTLGLPAQIRIVEKGEGATTGVEDAPIVAPATGDAHVYNLSGSHVARAADLKSLPRGVYIVNGKKVIK